MYQYRLYIYPTIAVYFVATIYICLTDYDLIDLIDLIDSILQL